MLRTAILVLSSVLPLALLAGCDDQGDARAPGESARFDDLPSTYPEDSVLQGHTTYEAHCASCHDTGLGGAPVTGEPADWEDRSGLWEAVLAEHVKAGYLRMPAKGGESDLSDLAVTQAVEHMMLVTYPEKSRD